MLNKNIFENVFKMFYGIIKYFAKLFFELVFNIIYIQRHIKKNILYPEQQRYGNRMPPVASGDPPHGCAADSRWPTSYIVCRW